MIATHTGILRVFHRWLQQCGHNVAFNTLRKQFLSHPDVGTLHSITDTLTQLNIPYKAVQVDSSSLDHLAEPFLALEEQENKMQYVLVTPGSNQIVYVYNGDGEPRRESLMAFKASFRELMIHIDKGGNSGSSAFGIRGKLMPLAVAISAVTFLFLQIPANIYSMAFLLLSLAGSAMGITLYFYGEGGKFEALDRFCRLSEKTDCTTVLQSGSAKLTQHVSLTDLAIVYFCFQLFCLSIFAGNYAILYLSSLVALVFTTYTVYQQAFVIKRWCPICLGITGIMIAQGLIAAKQDNLLKIDAETVALYLCLFVMTATGWFYLKQILGKANRLPEVETRLLAIKRNYRLFIPYHSAETPIDDQLLTNEGQIIIGSEHALVSITLITNPLCGACQKAHKDIEWILNQYQEDVSVRIVFNVPHTDPNDPRTMIAGRVINEYSKNKQEGANALHHWYQDPSLKAFRRLMISKDMSIEAQAILGAHGEWCMINQFSVSPLIMINNRLLPGIYSSEDLIYHIEAIIEFEQSREYQFQNHHNGMLVDNI